MFDRCSRPRRLLLRRPSVHSPHANPGQGRFGNACGRRFSRQQCIEPSLPEVMVARQRITEPTILHDDKRNTVGGAPLLVRPIGVECNPTIHQFRRGWNDFTGRART